MKSLPQIHFWRGRLYLLWLSALVLANVIVSEAAPIDEGLVDIKAIDPTIVVDLCYASPHNVTGHALYPANMVALIQPGVAQRLVRTQRFLREHNYGLKIWDAYRPQLVQMQLWHATHDGLYVADPLGGNGSLHTWGVAVDATLVDAGGRDVSMPTDFDEFTAAALLHYQGQDASVKWHLKVLQAAMGRAGFYGMRTKWWHFVAYDWKRYAPIRDVNLSAQ